VVGKTIPEISRRRFRTCIRVPFHKSPSGSRSGFFLKTYLAFGPPLCRFYCTAIAEP
jgi:hypothetical protein